MKSFTEFYRERYAKEPSGALLKIADVLDKLPEDRQDLGWLGLECWAYANSDQPIPDDLRAALIASTYEYEFMRRQIAREADRALAAHFQDDAPTITVIDDGSRSGIRLERHDRPNGDRAWLDFEIGDVLVSIDLIAGRRGLDLLIDGEQITGGMVADPLWTLDDLRQLHADLGKLLADPRLVGALAEQHDA